MNRSHGAAQGPRKSWRLKMKSDRPSSNINRRVLISSMALLPALSGMPFTAIAQTQAAQDRALGSWNDGPAKQAILDFVKTTTDRASPKFVTPEERVATTHPVFAHVAQGHHGVVMWRSIRSLAIV